MGKKNKPDEVTEITNAAEAEESKELTEQEKDALPTEGEKENVTSAEEGSVEENAKPATSGDKIYPFRVRITWPIRSVGSLMQYEHRNLEVKTNDPAAIAMQVQELLESLKK